MRDINGLDLKGFITQATINVFKIMFSVELLLTDDVLPKITEHHIVGSIDFTGDVIGSIKINVSRPFGVIMTAKIMGMKPNEVIIDEDIHDVIGEISNMVGGNLKSQLCDAGYPCDISIPSITSGSDFKMETFNWTRRESFVFRYQYHIITVELYIRSTV